METPPSDLYPPVYLHYDLSRGTWWLSLPGAVHPSVELPASLNRKLTALREAAIRAAKEPQ